MAIQARYKLFKSYSDPWEKMAEQVAEFLTTLGPGQVIGVSHSHENNLGVIAVWYWDVPTADQATQPDER